MTAKNSLLGCMHFAAPEVRTTVRALLPHPGKLLKQQGEGDLQWPPLLSSPGNVSERSVDAGARAGAPVSTELSETLPWLAYKGSYSQPPLLICLIEASQQVL